MSLKRSTELKLESMHLSGEMLYKSLHGAVILIRGTSMLKQ